MTARSHTRNRNKAKRRAWQRAAKRAQALQAMRARTIGFRRA